ncbi:hypothetical protein AB5I41_23150 [Sphingomonas sp. MMS24-JH45]
MPLADAAQRQDEAHAARRRVVLLGMRHDAGIEERRGLERIFLQQIARDDAAQLIPRDLARHEVRDSIEPRIEHAVEPAMPLPQHLRQPAELAVAQGGIHRHQPPRDPLGARMAGGGEPAGILGRERAQDGAPGPGGG